jgi:hypothetical protein
MNAHQHQEFDEDDLRAIQAQGGGILHEDQADFGGASLAFARQLDYVKARAYDRRYPDLRASVLVPDVQDVPEWVQTITVTSYDAVGMAKIVANYADDLPRADVCGVEKTIPVLTLGDSYGFTVNEIRASRGSGIGLDFRKAEAARRAIELKLNTIKLVGDAEYGLYGLFTHPSLPEMIMPHAGDWADLSGDEILQNLIAMQESYQRQSYSTHVANFLALAPRAHMALLTKTLSAGVAPT